MMMDPSIILRNEGPQILNALNAGNVVAGNEREVRRGFEQDALYAEHGAGILAGDSQAMNALAGFDPSQALSAQQTHQQMRISEERLNLARASSAREAERMRLAGEQAELEAEMQQMGLALPRLRMAQTDEEVNAILNELDMGGSPADASRPESVFNPASGPGLAGRDAAIATIIAMTEGAMEGLEYADQLAQGPAPLDTAVINGQLVDRATGNVVGDYRDQENQPGFRAATPEEAQAYGAQAGQIDSATGRFYPINPPSGMSLTTTPDGGIQLTQGPGVTQPDQPGGPRPALDGASMALEDIGEVRRIINDNPVLTTGLIGSWARNFPGTQAYDVDQLLTTVRANATFEVLGQMRSQSTTGSSGLGQVTNVEINLLGAALGSVEQAQSAEQLERALVRLERSFNQVVHGHPQGQEAAQVHLDAGWPLYGQIVDGSVYVGGNPNEQSSWQRVQQ